MHIALPVKILVLSALASTHTHLQCSGTQLPDMLSRSVVYVLLCSMLIFCGPMTQNFDRNAHSSNVLHVCCHVLFVHLYIVLGTVLIFTGMHAHLIYSKIRPKSSKTECTADIEAYEDPRRRELRKPDADANTHDHELLMKLQQAKVASGVS